ncbi:hypothetical protein BGW37DRAFT_11222 [Umbelopsis sp. PMI_123]|nr:hypothetical protein BGW37DRAFT_11222 [Umbelopsis sp. PMI_123]
MVVIGVFGALILIISTVDQLWTALSVSSPSFISHQVPIILGVLMRFLYRKTHIYFILKALGPLTVLTVLIIWYILIWISWAMIFGGFYSGAIVDTSTNEPAGTADIIYFTGNYVIFTLGIGDYTASNAIFKILTSVCACHGFFLVSINVAYVLNSTGAASETRRLAAEISGLGGSPCAMLLNSWNGRDLKALNTRIDNLLSSLCGQAQSHICYPSLYNYHSHDASGSAPCRLAALDEMLTVLLCACPAEIRPDHLCIIAAKNSITYYLETLGAVHILDGRKVPPPIDLDPLRKAGIPVVEQHIYEAEISRNKEILDRRSNLWAMVKAGGHTWEQVLTMPKFKADSKHYESFSSEVLPTCT